MSNANLYTSPFVINVPTRGLLAGETMHPIVQWLENLNIKWNMTSMFVNKKHRCYCPTQLDTATNSVDRSTCNWSYLICKLIWFLLHSWKLILLYLFSFHCCFISFPLFAVGISLPFFALETSIRLIRLGPSLEQLRPSNRPQPARLWWIITEFMGFILQSLELRAVVFRLKLSSD